MSVGFSELIVIIIIILAVMSPSKLNKLMYSAGKALSKLSENKEGISEELSSVTKEFSEITEPFKEAMKPITEIKEELESLVSRTKDDITNLNQNETINPSQNKE